MWPLSEDTTAILLLCAWFGGESEYSPLKLEEYNKLAVWLHRHNYRPRDLLEHSRITEKASRKVRLEEDKGYSRLPALLDRGITLGFYLEAWRRRGFWVIGREDAAYPKRIRSVMKSQSPPVLFGNGEVTLLDQGGVVIGGADRAVSGSIEHAGMIATLCAQNHRSVIVAGNRAVPTAAIENGIGSGGSTMWLLQGAMLAEPPGKMLRNAKATGKCLLLSTRSPADQRSISQEPEIGHILMALCDSAVYIDGAEISTDQYGLEMAIRARLPQKKCFVLSSEQSTALAEGLIQGGAQLCTSAQDAIKAGLFEAEPENSDPVPILETEDIENAEVVTDPPRDIPENEVEETVQGELFGDVPKKPQPVIQWRLTRSEEKYPGVIRANMGRSAPLSIYGIGPKDFLCSGGLAIIGPDSIPPESIEKACKAAETAAKQGQTVITAGDLNMAKKIVQTMHECPGKIIWVLSDRKKALNRHMKEPYVQFVRAGRLVMITAQNPDMSKESGEKSIVTSLAVELADTILYVDGFHNKRKDRFEAYAAARRRSEICSLLHGRPLSLEGKELKELGVKVWKNEDTDPV